MSVDHEDIEEMTIRQLKKKQAASRLAQAAPSSKKLLAPYVNNFTASACLMITEIAAGRLIAAFVGFSIYTWTSVIGVVLGGLAIGNYAGGRLADRYECRKILPGLFLASAVAAGATPFLNQMVGSALMYWHYAWTVKILVHVSSIFLLPSILLGMIGPVVTKWALDQGFKTGHTVGGIYAWGAVGSVFGTFLAGFYLIPSFGTHYIMFMIASLLGAFGFFHAIQMKTRVKTLSSILVFLVVAIACHGLSIANSAMLQPPLLDEIKTEYAKESQYSYVRVESSKKVPEIRVLKLDQLVHSVVDMRDPANINHPQQYDYVRVYASLTEQLFSKKNDLKAFVIGAGAYTVPRYLRRNWKNSIVEVSEIDPEVTRAAQKELGLTDDPGIRIHHQDARTRVEDMLLANRDGTGDFHFDVIYEDAINHVSVPYHLTTLEFHEKIKGLLAKDGVYLINIIASFDDERFLGAMYSTLEEAFPNIQVFVAGASLASNPHPWRTFVLACSMKPIDPSVVSKVPYPTLSESELESFQKNSGNLVLTDAFAPVDNLMAGMAMQRGQDLEREIVANKLLEQGIELVRKGDLHKAMRNFKQSVDLEPKLAAGAYYNMAVIRSGQGRFAEAVKLLQRSLQADPNFEAARTKMHQIGFKVSSPEREVNA